MIGKILIGVIVIFSFVLLTGLYACLVVGKQADEKMEEFMSVADSSEVASREVEQ